MEVYEELRKHLDKHPTGAPEAPEIIEILSALFTPKEARVASRAPFRPKTAEEIARRAGVGEDEARELLESMADKGLVYAREKEGEWGYALLPIMPGIFEFPYMKGVKDEKLERLAGLWHSYMEKIMDGLDSEVFPFARVVPIQEEVESRAEILPYEKVYEMIYNAKVVGLAHCACRVAEGNCDAPLEACMLFDDTCDYLVERGFARYISKDEMKRLLREFDEAGLVHNVNNSQDKLMFVCNCCPCCCGFMRALIQFEKPNVLATSGFLARVDPDACNGCAVCEDRCPMGAIVVADDVAAVDAGRCIGCALCVTGCPDEAVDLKRRDTIPETPATMPEMAVAVLERKGKLEEFIEVNR
ncbi:MAG: 4Fe-4S binding protein [Actinobacteria bacterium]|nr:4Fe-4S binding protein [Actinomycetota bacterium]MBU4489725.1 4Fe-4S binding protein [Actinomycetota bacterium]